MIGDAHHRTVEHSGRNSARLPIARSIHASENPPQAFENELIHEAAAVVAYIDNQAFFADLRKELRSEEHTSELQSRFDLVCRLLLEKKNNKKINLLFYQINQN